MKLINWAILAASVGVCGTATAASECNRPLASFSWVILQGHRGGDGICVSQGFLSAGEKVSSREQSAVALGRAGWSIEHRRRSIAAAWVRDAICDDGFAANVDGKVTTLPDGSVAVEVTCNGVVRMPIDAAATPTNRVRVTFNQMGNATVRYLADEAAAPAISAAP